MSQQISSDLSERILDSYPSKELRYALEKDGFAAVDILTQMVFMEFDPNKIQRLAEKRDCAKIRQICKDNLHGQALLGELHRELQDEKMN